jgi:hypothetical protein
MGLSDFMKRKIRLQQVNHPDSSEAEKPKLRLENTVSKSVSSERDRAFVHITFRSHLPELGRVKLARPA